MSPIHPLFLIVMLTAAAASTAGEQVLPRLLEVGDTRGCIMKLSEPTLSGDQVGRIEVLALVAVGEDGRVTKVELPELAQMTMQNWARSRVQRWVNCVGKAMRFEPGTVNGVPTAFAVDMPLKSWVEFGQDQLQPRQSVQAVLRSAPHEVELARRECESADIPVEQAVIYQFSIDRDGRARDVRVLDSGTSRFANQAGHCIIGKLVFEPQTQDGEFARTPVHWPVTVSPQGTR